MAIGRADLVGRTYQPFSFRALDRIAASASPLTKFLLPLAFRDVTCIWDDFWGDTINTDLYTTSADSGATAPAIPSTASLNGVLEGATGTTDNAGFSITGAPIWRGDNNCVLMVRMAMLAVSGIADGADYSAFELELGWINTATDTTLPVVTDVDTPATGNGGTDVAVLHIDTDQTLTTMAFVTDGSTTGMNATATTLSPVFTPAANTYYWYVVGLAGNAAYAMVDGARLVGHGGATASQVEGGTLIQPWIYVRTRDTTSKLAHIDSIVVLQDKAVRVA